MGFVEVPLDSRVRGNDKKGVWEVFCNGSLDSRFHGNDKKGEWHVFCRGSSGFPLSREWQKRWVSSVCIGSLDPGSSPGWQSEM